MDEGTSAHRVIADLEAAATALNDWIAQHLR